MQKRWRVSDKAIGYLVYLVVVLVVIGLLYWYLKGHPKVFENWNSAM